MRALARRHPAWAVGAVSVLPLLVAVVALRWRPWAPVLDLAMTELRVRDVGGRFTPRIGLPGRIGDFPDQGSHPGPWSFYLLAPFHRLAGGSAWGMQLGSVAINATAFGAVVAIGRRLAGVAGAFALGAVVAVAIRGFGLNVLTHPWNPYFPLALWLLLLVAAWAVVAGEHRLATVVALCASIAAQTHVPYLVSCALIVVLVLGVLVRRRSKVSSDERGAIGRSINLMLVVTAVLWLPPLADQLRRDPGNMVRLVRHFTGEPSEPLIPLRAAVGVFLRHLDVFGASIDATLHTDGFLIRSGLPGTPAASALGGLIVLGAWFAAAIVARRREHRLLGALNAVLAVALIAEFVSITRIFGKVWFYLTLWAWMTTLLVALSVLWTLALVVRDQFDVRLDPSRLQRLAGAIGGVATVLSVGAVAVHDVPEPNLSDGLRATVDPTLDAVEQRVGAAVGREGTYLVFWQDAVFIGAQGYGLVNELERRGLDVGVHDTWRVPVTQHRVLAAGSYDAELHLVSGDYLDEWRRRPDHVEVATVDVRTDEERERFGLLRARVERRLGEIDRSDLMPKVDGNLFGASLDPELPQDIVDALSEMLLIGEPVSVFIAPPDSSF